MTDISTHCHCCTENVWEGSKSGNRDASGTTVPVANSHMMVVWPKAVDAQTVGGCGEGVDWATRLV